MSGHAWRRDVEQWWMRLPEPVRSPAWPYTLASLTVLFLLLAFHQVVRDAVRQGELLRAASASVSQATWRCGALPGLRARENCLAQLNVPPQEGAQAALYNVSDTALAGR